MGKITIEDYKIAIRDKFRVIQKEGLIFELVECSPAQLRDLSVVIYDKKLSKNDEIIFTSFFEIRDGMKIRLNIHNFNTDKFKQVGSFLKESRIINSSRERIEMAAILVDFHPRPFSSFLEASGEVPTKKVNKEPIIEDDIQYSPVYNPENNNPSENPKLKVQTAQNQASNNSFFRRIKNEKYGIAAGIFLIGALTFIIFFNNSDNCMIWKNDHYEAVSCDAITETQSFVATPVLKKEDDLVTNFQKVKVCDTTSFFKLGKPCIWYGKSFKGEYEFFSSPGLHPETRKTLRPITSYMIRKHIKK